MYNVDLMLQVRNQITAEPKSHRQESYENFQSSCGTTRCIAGWAIFFANGGVKSIYDTTVRRYDRDYEGFESASDAIAAQEMGISPEEALKIFHCMNEIDALALLDELIEKGKNQ